MVDHFAVNHSLHIPFHHLPSLRSEPNTIPSPPKPAPKARLTLSRAEKDSADLAFVLLTPASASPGEIAQAKRTSSVRVLNRHCTDDYHLPTKVITAGQHACTDAR